MANKIKKELPDLRLKDANAWRSWLEENASSSEGVWLVLGKKDSGKENLTVQEAIDEALCFGWIDSLPRALDDQHYKILFTPRKPGSNWSKKNKERVEALVNAGKMAEPGNKTVALAKENGSWEALEEVDALLVPEDLKTALDQNPEAKTNFEAFPPSTRRGILEWIFNAKKSETRRKRIADTVSLAARNIRANQYRQPKKQ